MHLREQADDERGRGLAAALSPADAREADKAWSFEECRKQFALNPRILTPSWDPELGHLLEGASG